MRLLLVEQEKNREVFLSGYSTLILFVCVDLGHAYDEDGVVVWLLAAEHICEILSAACEGDSPLVTGALD